VSISQVIFNPAVIGMIVLFLAVIWMLRDQNDKTRAILVFALLLNLFYNALLTVFMSGESALFPMKYDYILFHLDQSLGIRSTSIARALQGAARLPLLGIYLSMTLVMIAWYLLTERRGRRGSAVLAYVAELLSGPVFCGIVPGCGPIYAFGKQWLNPPAVPIKTIPMTEFPNAFPSFHVGTACALVFLAPGRIWKFLALLFLAGTAMATISTGEHYIIDLVPGLACGVFFSAVGLRNFRRAACFFLLAIAWSLSVRFGFLFLIAHPIVTRSFALLTVTLVAVALWKQWHSPLRQEDACETALEAISQPELVAQ
jgi:hypothetical protein